MKTAMILAAGRGERLRPLTDKMPKAMCRVQGVPLIEHHVRNLVQAGFEKNIINHAHLGGQIRQYLGNGAHLNANIEYSAEPPGGLETGGGILYAREKLGSEPFVTVNADIYTDFDFSQLPLTLTSLIHAVLVPKNTSLGHPGDFGLTADRKLTNQPQKFTLCGITCYHPSVFASCTLERFSVARIIRLHAETKTATGEVYNGVWFDIGTQVRLDSSRAALTALESRAERF